MKWILFFSLIGCAQVTSLNLKKHQFGLLPSKIIWFQIAGFEEEQMAMLRFHHSEEKKTSFENMTCLGKTWGYNLFKLRTTAEQSFLAQITGKKNIKGTCEDSKHKPIWDYLYRNGYTVAILENLAEEKQSLMSLNQCSDKSNLFSRNTAFYLRKKPSEGQNTFSYTEKIPSRINEIYFDQTCSQNSCSSTLFEDFRAIYERNKKLSPKHLMVVRDFSYLRALRSRKFQEAKEILNDIEKAYAEALKYSNSSDYLILLTSGESQFVDMPDQGRAWFEFENKSKNISVKRTKLTNIVLASGARAENFCGVYSDSDVFMRILSGPKQQGLELKVINPFQ